MGTKWSPHYADIYMDYFEQKALEKCPHKPFIYLRYLDDIFIIWHHGDPLWSRNFEETTQNLWIFLIPTNHPSDSRPPSMKIP